MDSKWIEEIIKILELVEKDKKKGRKIEVHPKINSSPNGQYFGLYYGDTPKYLLIKYEDCGLHIILSPYKIPVVNFDLKNRGMYEICQLLPGSYYDPIHPDQKIHPDKEYLLKTVKGASNRSYSESFMKTLKESILKEVCSYNSNEVCIYFSEYVLDRIMGKVMEKYPIIFSQEDKKI